MIELLDASHQFIPPNSIFIPYTFKKRGGRKVILVPETSETNDESSDLQTDNVMADALAKAHLWTKQLQSGKYKSVRELSKAKKTCLRYTQYLLQLVFLSPQIQEAIMNGTQPRHLVLRDMLNDIPVSWAEQHDKWGFKRLVTD